MSDQTLKLLPEHKTPTMRDVAALAGVGIKTVSRVINGEPNVSPAMEARVRQAAAQLNYSPDFYAGSLRRSGRKTHTLGLLVGSIANPFSGAIARAVEDVAAARGTAVLIASLDDDPAREVSLVGEFLRRRVDGLVLTTIAPSQAYLLPEQQRGTAMIFVDRRPVAITGDAVLSDNARGARAAVDHLVRHGHRRIAYLGDIAALWTARERLRGFLEGTDAAGIPRNEVSVVEGAHDEVAARVAVRELLSAQPAPTALFTSQNLITIGALRALRELGLHRRVALVGFDDVAMADLLEPGVTVVAQNAYRIGQLAAERLFARLDGDSSAPEEDVVDVELIVRGSGEIPPGGTAVRPSRLPRWR